ncbi:LytTR family two component transcriptional regulator [Breznakibacter xylanolyticus]|uniref:LytTR family two component transcriptional regulator n=1 Tax=Breznakibacter xylanolyticus TaxID=990 RepID=A0A2W7N1V3_9BACT|nr:LytTR family DNA-binding domain-containing protein [Breznakibacter xylanolyticus]PZX14385.1 LytTR family two component transcriptional regulator [Breznakibacter xylanolyticus]
MNILIIEDEALAANNLAEMIQKLIPEAHIVAKIESVREAVSWLKNNTPQLIFCDIQLSDGISFSIFEQTQVNTPVIFTTAYDQYAIKAFKVNSIDYLLKPIDEQALKGAMDKYQRTTHSSPIDYEALIATLTQRTEYRERLVVYVGQKMVTVKCSDISHFFTTDGNVFFTTFEGKTYDVDFTLDKLEGMLNPRHFYRINRQMIIHIEAIDTMYHASKSRIKLTIRPPFNQDVFVSFNNTPGFKEWLNR